MSFFSPAKVSCESRGRLRMLRAGQQLLDHRPHGGGAEHQRLLAAAAVEHAVGEDVAALEIGAELHLVDRDEGHVEIARHRLDGGDPEARVRRLDLLLAGDQRDVLGADPVDDLVVDLAREQPQRQPDHAGRVRQHALDGEMGLAGVGRPEHGGDAGAAGADRGRGRRERDGHRLSGLREEVGPRLSSEIRSRRNAVLRGQDVERRSTNLRKLSLSAAEAICDAPRFLYHNATPKARAVKLGNEFERIAAESVTPTCRLRSPRHLGLAASRATTSGAKHRVLHWSRSSIRTINSGESTLAN